MDAPKVDRVILTIDENLRIIDIPNLAVVIGAEGDKDVNRLYFKMDRLYRGTDLAAFTPASTTSMPRVRTITAMPPT